MGAITLTAEVVGQRKTDLDRAIQLADDAYHSAAFKAQTGAAKTEEVTAAKAHLDQLRADREALDVAWAMAARQDEADRAAQRQARYDAGVTAANEMIAKRREAVLLAQEAAGKVAEAVLAYTDATEGLRKLMMGYTGNVQGGGSARDNAQHLVHLALDPAKWAASMAAGAVFGDAGVHLSTSLRSDEVFGQLTAVQFEDATARHLRAAFAKFAPDA